MAKLSLKKDFQNGQILYGEDLNTTNGQIETAFNMQDDLVQLISNYIQEILPDAKEYTDEQIAAAVEDFTLTEAYKQDIADLNQSISEVGSVANNAAEKADLSFNAINNFVNVTFINSQEISRYQPDGKIESIFSNADPYESWIDKSEHDGDMWFNTTTKVLKRYDYETDSWFDIINKSIIDSYNNASLLKGAKDEKITTFVTTPTTPYDIQDLFPDGGTINLKICKTARATGEYNPADWELASKYTDDSGLNSFINDNYSDFVNAVNGITSLYYSYNDPSIDWNTAEKKDLHVGDIWRDRNTNIIYKYNKSADAEPVYSWIEDNIPENMFDIIDGKKSIYTELPSSYSKNDIFVVPPGIEGIPNRIKAGDILVASKNSTTFSWDDWIKKDNSISQDIMNSVLIPINNSLTEVVNDLDLNVPGSKLSQIIQSINSVTTNFQIKGGANLINNSLQLFESINNDTFEKTGTWEIRQNQQISENTASKFMNYCIAPGKLKWVIKTIPNTAYTISLIYNNDSGDTSTLKLTNGNKLTLISETTDKLFKYYAHGFIANSDSIIIELETTGDNFGYSDLILNYGAIIEGSTILPNALKWQPAPGENFGTIIKLSYEGEEITMKNGLFKHVMDNNGDRIILVSTGETITEFDENGISTPKGEFKSEITVGLFTELKIDEENQVEY